MVNYALTGTPGTGKTSLSKLLDQKVISLSEYYEEVIKKSTLNPSEILGLPELGHLGEGSEADIAVLKIIEGDFGLIDNGLTGNRKLNTSSIIENQLTIKSGRVVWDRNGLSFGNYEDTPKPDYDSIY